MGEIMFISRYKYIYKATQSLYGLDKPLLVWDNRYSWSSPPSAAIRILVNLYHDINVVVLIDIGRGVEQVIQTCGSYASRHMVIVEVSNSVLSHSGTEDLA